MNLFPLVLRIPRPLPALLVVVALSTGCMSLRHKVDPVDITLNVKLENMDEEGELPSVSTASVESGTPAPAAEPAALAESP